MKIALVHDYLTQLGGAEKVLAGLLEIYQDSTIFVLLYNRQRTGNEFPPHKVKSSWLNYLPLSRTHHQWYLTLLPLAVESLKLTGYNIIISSASSVGKGIIKPASTLHICYCHTPTRYLWHDSERYIDELGYNRLVKKIIRLFIPGLRHWDFMASRRVDYFIANSKIVSARIRRYYHRDSAVIYPPVDTDKFYLSKNISDYYLIGGRLVSYKKYDLAIRTFNKLGIHLKVFGTGDALKGLKKIAGKNIEFLGTVSDAKKADLMSRARAFIYPQVEDFGITAVESMASGRPVIAYRNGGALETIIPGLTGEFFDEQIWESLSHRLIHFDPFKYRPELIKAHAEKFNTRRFQEQMVEFVNRASADFELAEVFKIKLKN